MTTKEKPIEFICAQCDGTFVKQGYDYLVICPCSECSGVIE